MFKQGGLPPIKYCPANDNNNANKKNDKTKERFFANAPRQNINIRQLLSETKKKPIIIDDNINDNDNLEIIESI